MQKEKLTFQTLKNADIIEINELDHHYVENQITHNLNVLILSTASTALENTLQTHPNVKCGKKITNKILKKHLF